MRYIKYLVSLLSVLMLPLAYSQAEVTVGVGIGPAYGYVGAPPVCSYGYYNYYPYACAPYGYYGPNWFVNGVFIGAGPWYHGYWGHRDWDHRGWYGGRDFDRGDHFRGGFRGGEARAFNNGGGFHGGGFRSSGGFHGSGAFHGGGGFHGRGHR